MSKIDIKLNKDTKSDDCYSDKFKRGILTDCENANYKCEKCNYFNSKSKVAGRPRKVDDKILLKILNMYVLKHNSHPELLKPTKVSKYANELGLNTTYQDFTRCNATYNYIQEYNRMYKRVIVEGGVISIDSDEELPIYEKIDINMLIKNNKTSKDIEKVVNLLNISNEKLSDSYAKIKSKMLIQAENIIKQDKEIECLKNQLIKLEEDNKQQVKKLNEEIKKYNEKQNIMSRKIAIYEEFINLYHYDSIKQYALYLENIISDKVSINEAIFDEKMYIEGTYSLKDVINKFDNFLLKVDKTSNYCYEEISKTDNEGNLNLYIELDDEDFDDDLQIDYSFKEMEESLLKIANKFK